MILATGTDEDRQRSLSIVDDLLARRVLLADHCFFAEILMLLGHPERACEVARDAPETERRTQWLGYSMSLDYYANKITERDMRDFASQLSATRCWAYYSIGIKSLADGDRKKAKECFQKTRDTRGISWWLPVQKLGRVPKNLPDSVYVNFGRRISSKPGSTCAKYQLSPGEG